MEGNTARTFPLGHVDFESDDSRLTDDERTAKKLTFLAASAVSLLAYEPYETIENALQTNARFEHVRTLDLLSGVWPVANITPVLKSNQQSYPHPIIAWSTLLQTVFVGFRGTDSMADVLTDINVTQKTNPGLATRFHAGFHGRGELFVPLISELAARFNVVVCGHSLGGAVATIASYKGLNGFPKPNVWESEGLGLSVVTFGTPTAMVGEHSTTAAPIKTLAPNFHHVINPDDVVPFATSELKGWTRQLLDILKNNTNIAGASARLLGIPQELARGLLQLVSIIVYSGVGEFAHFGRLYLLESKDSNLTCQQVISKKWVPTTPDLLGFLRFHAMEHYAHCMRRAIPQATRALDLGFQDEIGSHEFASLCWPLPETFITCRGTVSDRSVIVLIEMDTRFVQFFIEGVLFELDGNYFRIDGVCFEPTPTHGLVLRLHHDIKPEDGIKESLRLIDAIQRGVYIENSFSWNTVIPVQKMEGACLADASVPGTFAAVRLAMLAAFIDQMTKVQRLCRSEIAESNRAEAGILTPKASRVVRYVDQLVLGAAPQLVVARLEHAWSIVEDLWPQSEAVPENASVSADIPERQDIATRALELGLSSCPPAFLTVLFDMLNTLENNGISPSCDGNLPDDWKPSGSGQLASVYPQTISFGAALKRFSLALHDPSRPLQAGRRIEYAIQQASDVLTAMRFCHLIIITQLALPRHWYCKIMYFSRSHILGPLVSIPTGLYSGIAFLPHMAFLAASVVGVAVAERYLVRTPNDMNFASSAYVPMLKFSMDILGLRSSSLLETGETPLSKLLIHGNSDPLPSLKLLEVWQSTLKSGLKRHLKLSSLTLGSGWDVAPTLQWAKWLYDAARAGKLREVLSSEFRIGVEGPVKAGKSELLTVLTNAPLTVFCPGEDGEHRTMEIQMYQPSGTTSTIFVDCPGVDDCESEIGTMGRIVREMLGVIIFVFPVTTVLRTNAAKQFIREVAKFFRLHDSTSDYRPARILLSKADMLEHDPSDPLAVEAYRRRQSQYKADFIKQLMALGSFPEGFKVLSRQRCQDMTLVVAESLEEVVQLYSNHAQMSADRKALCDYENPAGVRRALWHPEHFLVVNGMVKAGEIWDVVSLRMWLGKLWPNCIFEKLDRVGV